ncbi:MAG TPA: hypothetical protein DCO75_05100 [Fibrobacteres bacterium]|nr:hypothetical protein [Fibrobacterota bacterium]
MIRKLYPQHFMNSIISYIKIIRPANALMTAIAVILGAWLSKSNAGIRSIILLVIAAISATGFGNVINDIKDIDTDRISHPGRPLPKKEISPDSAVVFAFFLLSFSIVNSFLVSKAHCIATVIPLVLLSIYAIFLKGTPFAGNIIVSVLAAYPLVFGGLFEPQMSRLLVPALLAFLLNTAREIAKDFQDIAGDMQAGLKTTAIMPQAVIKSIMLFISASYTALLFVPFFLKQFGMAYALVCAVIVLPLNIYWSILVIKSSWISYVSKISLILKMEMLAGLAALAIDQLIMSL